MPSPVKPRIALTMGDPAGVGPELCLRALDDKALREVCVPIVLGDYGLLARVATACGVPPPDELFSDVSELPGVTVPSVLSIPGLDAAAVSPGCVDAATGAAAYRYVAAAIAAALAGQVDAICTAPIHKEALQAAGVPYAGHTEILADATGTGRACMMLTSERITCSLVTTHIGLRDVPAALTERAVLETIELTAAAMQRIRGHRPRLLVCGLNPHAGEGGLFGQREEERIIMPAIAAARAKGVEVTGPLPPDTAFLPDRLAGTDAYICMYHDQGLIPLKMLAFDSAVNITLGLPIIRTSVDHGTALDLAWQGTANPNSLYEAIRLAARLCD
jgi:4-phospho-D-threonate 3-dehydrogenase / 4-phospho-D-erythronate 3-dehydrogenase